MDIEHQIKKYYKQLCVYALHFVPDTAAVEDMVLEVFVDTWKSQAEVRDVKAYLFASVRNRCLNYLRKRSLSQVVVDLEELAAEDPADDAEVESHIWSVLDALPNRMREAFLLSKRDGMRYEDIAARLGISVHTVRNHIVKASRKIRHILEEL